MSLLPNTTHSTDLSPYQDAQATRYQRKAEIAIFRHELEAVVRSEFDRQDAQAAADAIRSSLEEEMDLLDYGLHRANGSAAKTELVARKVQQLASINDRRISRRFGR